MKLLSKGALGLCAGLIFALNACTYIAPQKATEESVAAKQGAINECVNADIADAPLPTQAEIVRVMSYAEELSHLNSIQMHEQYRLTKLKFAENPANDIERFRLVLLLAHSPADFKDYKAAAALLDEYVKRRSDKDPLLNSFATLLTVILKDQVSLAERENSLERKLVMNEKNLKLLQSQLDALKSIETSIHQRDLGEGHQ